MARAVKIACGGLSFVVTRQIIRIFGAIVFAPVVNRIVKR